MMASARGHLLDLEIAGDVPPLSSNDQSQSERNQQPRCLANHRVSPLTAAAVLTVSGAAAMSSICRNSPDCDGPNQQLPSPGALPSPGVDRVLGVAPMVPPGEALGLPSGCGTGVPAPPGVNCATRAGAAVAAGLGRTRSSMGIPCRTTRASRGAAEVPNHATVAMSARYTRMTSSAFAAFNAHATSACATRWRT